MSKKRGENVTQFKVSFLSIETNVFQHRIEFEFEIDLV